MILLTARDLSRQFDRDPLFSGLSLELRAGDRVGLVGPNGTGKTTLLHCLIGRDHPDTGEVVAPNDVTIALLEQEPDFDPGRTLLQEAKAGLAHLYQLQEAFFRLTEQLATAPPAQQERLHKRYDDLHHELERQDAFHVEHRIDEVLSGLGFSKEDYDRPVSSFSGGQQSRIMLARILLRAPDVMLLDEPTNHLDIASTEWLEGFLNRFDKAVVVVSHDRYFLDRVTTRILELHAGRATEYRGNFSAYWRQREERLKVLEREYEKQQEFIERTEDFIRRNKAGQKSVQAKDREKKLARVERIELPQDFQEVRMAFGTASRTGDIVLDVEGLAKGFGDELLFQDITLRLLRGERLGIVGPNGCGKTTLLRTLLGELPPDVGKVRIGANVKIGYYDQQLTSVDPSLDAVEAVRPPERLDFTPGMARGLLARFGVKGELQMQTVGAMSGGEKSRVALARLAAKDVNVLVLDEPTNHLDLWARDALEQALRDFGGTLIFVSHDRYFLDRLANRVLVWGPDRWRLHDGNYTDYVEFRKRVEAPAPPDAKLKPTSSKPVDTKKPSASLEKPKRKFPFRTPDAIEADIAAKEDELAALEGDMMLPETLRDGEKVKAIGEQYARVKAELARLYEHWEEATTFDA
jgi:ATP-binding cassette subfamily F protein 3